MRQRKYITITAPKLFGNEVFTITLFEVGKTMKKFPNISTKTPSLGNVIVYIKKNRIYVPQHIMIVSTQKISQGYYTLHPCEIFISLKTNNISTINLYCNIIPRISLNSSTT